MAEDGRGGWPDAAAASGSKPASSFERAGDRLRLAVELCHGETTIVSWRKLVREATSRKPNGPDPPVSVPTLEVNQLPISQPQPSLPAVGTAKPQNSETQPGSNRLASVIERIERLYAGDGSSDEEDVVLDDVPDDDEYDTEDSFIDDVELDDYFKIDKSMLKHDGFFVNRGKLERIEPTISTDQQPKKRRRKDGIMGQGGDDGHNPNKLMKTGYRNRKASSLNERNSTSRVPNAAESNVLSVDLLSGNSLANAAEISGKKKDTDAQITSVPSALPNADGIVQDKGDDPQKNLLLPSLNHKQKESNEAQRSNDRNSRGSKSQSVKQQSNPDKQDQTIHRKQKVGLSERFDLNVPAMRDSLQIPKTLPLSRKEGSNVKSRVTMLEKAIRDLEKIVAESRPPSMEVQDNDNSSQGAKRRLPVDIKQKLAKVARLAHDCYGKIPKDVINRLMSIVGHLMQLRTLKRNLKVMANLGLSVKQAKDDQLQKIKLEVAEMVRQRISYIESKVEQQTTSSDDFQDTCPEDKEALKRKCRMDDALENKICDLYDLYIERLEEHSGPPVKRLYEEIAALWPSGVMEIDGIKRAIHKAKKRRKAVSALRKDQDKIKKKVLASKAEDSVRAEAINLHPSLHAHENLLPEYSDGASPLTSNQALTVVACLPVPYTGNTNANKLKQERVKGSSDTAPTDAVHKKKAKKKLNSEKVEAESRLDKPTLSHVEEKPKHHKQHLAGPYTKPNTSE